VSSTDFPPCDRRDFLKGAAAGLILVPRPALRTVGSHLIPRKTTVAIVRTGDRKEGVRRVMALLDLPDIAGKAVNLKPNFNTADPSPASTHVDTLAQIVSELKARDAREVVVGESSFPPTAEVMEAKGVESEHNVSTCCLKTHAYGGVFTMSLKLAVGLTPKSIRRGMHRSPHMRRMIAELNQGYTPRLIIMDGVEAFTDGGPSSGRLARANVMIGGTDRVAVDAVGLAVLNDLAANTAIMETPIFQQEQMARAVDVGLGIQGPQDIAFVRDDEAGTAYAARLREILD